MIKNLPWYIPSAIFLINTIFLIFWILSFYFALRRINHPQTKKIVLIIAAVEIAWSGVQGVLAYTGFYLNFESTIPRFLLAIVPPIVLMIILLSLSRVWKVLDAMLLSSLTYLPTIRIAVELVIWGLFLYGTLPKLMTFAGKNPDILTGLTAPIVAYLCFTKRILSRKFALVWHILGLGLLINISTLFILSAPSSIQVISPADNPNVGFFYFPFIWAPAHGVPSSMFAHCIAIRRLWKLRQTQEA